MKSVCTIVVAGGFFIFDNFPLIFHDVKNADCFRPAMAGDSCPCLGDADFFNFCYIFQFLFDVNWINPTATVGDENPAHVYPVQVLPEHIDHRIHYSLAGSPQLLAYT